ncbi:hypothetical protein GCM10009741_78460 [Kribbella lupini]|uniref:Uncharacterized protein n=1 Tax=Kribbella lupini TaxID=291602 RepID=A0ABN2CRF5_9ACTN
MDALEHAPRGQVVEIAADGHVGGAGQFDQFGDRDPGRALQAFYDDTLTFGTLHGTESNISACAFKHSAC